MYAGVGMREGGRRVNKGGERDGVREGGDVGGSRDAEEREGWIEGEEGRREGVRECGRE